jgi:hypothetical protein
VATLLFLADLAKPWPLESSIGWNPPVDGSLPQADRDRGFWIITSCHNGWIGWQIFSQRRSSGGAKGEHAASHYLAAQRSP